VEGIKPQNDNFIKAEYVKPPENRIENEMERKENNQIKEKNIHRDPIHSPQLSQKNKTSEINEPRNTKGLNEVVESEPKLNKPNGFQPAKFNREELKRYMEMRQQEEQAKEIAKRGVEEKKDKQQEEQVKGIAKREVEEKKKDTTISDEAPNKTEAIMMVEVSKDITITEKKQETENKKELLQRKKELEAQLKELNAQLIEN